MTQLVEEKHTHPPIFASLPLGAPAGGPGWLEATRKSAIDRFKLVGFPSSKQEEWRFTSIAAIARTPFAPGRADAPALAVAAESAPRFGFGADAAAELVFVNGCYSARLSRLGKLPRGVQAGSLASAIASGDRRVEAHLGRYADPEANPFVALNAGALHDGAFIHFARGATLAEPIHLLYLSVPGAAPTASHPRLLVVLEDGAIGTLVESYAGAGAYFTNAVAEIVAAPGSRLDHCKLQQESPESFHVATLQVKLAQGARFVSHSVSIGARLTRNDLNVVLAGERADATLNGVVLASGEQHVDNHTLLDHAAPNCSSHELYKHVLDGKSTGVFKGKIVVRQIAQKTDSKQTSKSLLLSDDAVMNGQPALEIYADEVKCTHGSTIGPVDEEQVFYMRSRGVGLEAARHLMTYAFAADVTRRIKVEPVRRRIEEYMAARHGLPQDLRIADLGAHDEAAVNL